MIISVLEDVTVLDLATSLLAASGGKMKAIKTLLKRAEDEANYQECKELFQLMRLKLTQLEDQWDGEAPV